MDDLKKSIQVKVGEVDKRTVRLLTHLDVNSDEIDLALVKLEYVSKEFLENSIWHDDVVLFYFYLIKMFNK